MSRRKYIATARAERRNTAANCRCAVRSLFVLPDRDRLTNTVSAQANSSEHQSECPRPRLCFTLHLLVTLRYDLVHEASLGKLHTLGFARRSVARMLI